MENPRGSSPNGRVHFLSVHSQSDVKLSCSDGDTVTSPPVLTPRGVTFAVRSNRFGIEARNDTTGFGWDADGAFRSRGRRATGTLRVFAIFNEQNQQDADGSIRCASAAFGWTARRA